MELRLLRPREVVNLVGISRTTVYEYEHAGRFPRRVVLGPRAVAWRSNEIREWIELGPDAWQAREAQRQAAIAEEAEDRRWKALLRGEQR